MTMRKAFFKNKKLKHAASVELNSYYLVAITSKKFRQAHLQGGI